MTTSTPRPKLAQATRIDRRRFLAATGLAPLAGAMGATAAAAEDDRPDTDRKSGEPGRYRETAHVREAYRLSRF